MNATDLSYTPALELGRLYRAKTLSPVEVTEAALARIERLNPKLNAYLTVTADHARELARAAEARLGRGQPRGPLDGIPYSIKDLEPTAGIRTTFGSKFFEQNVPTEDGAVASRLRGSGGVLLGKTNTPHFGYKDMCDNLIGPPCKNPWNLARTSGASSGGVSMESGSRASGPARTCSRIAASRTVRVIGPLCERAPQRSALGQ
jgi:Asp-tRNA(Asn)/Glu-tRNA(Gln) amidotransferase A subunit family amidase